MKNTAIKDLQKLNDIPMDFIEHSIELALQCIINKNRYFVKTNHDLTHVYFVGRTLVLDTKDEFGNTVVILINHSTETFNFFVSSNGFKRLLSIRALKALETLLKVAEVTYTSKWNI